MQVMYQLGINTTNLVTSSFCKQNEGSDVVTNLKLVERLVKGPVDMSIDRLKI